MRFSNFIWKYILNTHRVLPALCALVFLTLVACAPGNGGNAGNAAPDNAPANGASQPDDKPQLPKEAAYPHQVNAELARVYLKYNIVDEALRLFDLAIAQQLKATGTEDADNWMGLGDALNLAKQGDKAKLAYERALAIIDQILKERGAQLKPQDANALITRAATLCQVLGRNDARVQYLSQLKADENNAAQQLELAKVLEQVGQADKAEVCFKRAIELSKGKPADTAIAEIEYASMLLRAKRLDDALAHAKLAHEIKDVPEATGKAARRLLFEIYEARGESDKFEIK
jgi:tetratricopeptide (TPR) repeat protein